VRLSLIPSPVNAWWYSHLHLSTYLEQELGVQGGGGAPKIMNHVSKITDYVAIQQIEILYGVKKMCQVPGLG
jgi:hypothetical protein